MCVYIETCLSVSYVYHYVNQEMDKTNILYLIFFFLNSGTCLSVIYVYHYVNQEMDKTNILYLNFLIKKH